MITQSNYLEKFNQNQALLRGNSVVVEGHNFLQKFTKGFTTWDLVNKSDNGKSVWQNQAKLVDNVIGLTNKPDSRVMMVTPDTTPKKSDKVLYKEGQIVWLKEYNGTKNLEMEVSSDFTEADKANGEMVWMRSVGDRIARLVKTKKLDNILTTKPKATRKPRAATIKARATSMSNLRSSRKAKATARRIVTSPDYTKQKPCNDERVPLFKVGDKFRNNTNDTDVYITKIIDGWYTISESKQGGKMSDDVQTIANLERLVVMGTFTKINNGNSPKRKSAAKKTATKKPAAKKTAAKKTAAKKPATRKKAAPKPKAVPKSTQRYNSASKATEKSAEIKAINRFLGLVKRGSIKRTVMSALTALQKDITMRRIRKTSPLASEVNRIQKEYIETLNSGKYSLTPSQNLLDDLNAAVSSTTEYKSVVLMKRLVNALNNPKFTEKGFAQLKNAFAAALPLVSSSDPYAADFRDINVKLQAASSFDNFNFQQIDLSGITGLPVKKKAY